MVLQTLHVIVWGREQMFHQYATVANYHAPLHQARAEWRSIFSGQAGFLFRARRQRSAGHGLGRTVVGQDRQI